MQKRLWRTDGLFVGIATLLTMGCTVLARPADLKTIVINGGTAGLSALGIVTWIGHRHRQTQAMLRQDLRSHLQNTVDTARMLPAEEFKQAMQLLNQKLNDLEQDQTELKQVRLQLNAQWRETQARTQSLEEQFATLPALQQQVQAQIESLRDRVSPKSPQSERAPIPKPIKQARAIEEFGSKQAESVIQWLEQHHVRVSLPPPPTEHDDDHYNHLALYLGDHYAALKVLHAYMKRALHSPNQPKSFWFVPQGLSDTDFRICAKFCNELKRAFLVEGDFRLRPDRKILEGKLAEDGVLRGFLDGKWFERFVYQKMTQILTEKGLDHACLLNAKMLSLQTGRTEAELDMMFLIEGQPLCIECKSGQYQQEDARKFAQYAEKLGLAKPCAIFVVLEDHAPDIELQKPRMGTITMTTSSQLGTTLEAALQSMEALVVEIGEEAVAEPKVGTETANKALNQLKVRYRPIPSQRAAVWQGLMALFSAERSQEPPNFFTLKSLLAERVGISKTQINGVLLLLRNADYFWDEQKSPVTLLAQPISALRSLNLADAERTFVEEYVKNVLRLDWNFFDEAAQCQQFKAVIGAEVPDEETLERLKQDLCEGEDEFN